MPSAHYEKKCPNCGRAIHGINPSVLEINLALHLKKHELQDDVEAGRLQRLAHLAGRMTSKTGLIVVGYFVAAWVVVYLNKFAWPWVYLGFPVFFIPLSVGVWFGARKYRRPYLKGWASFAGWLISIVIGGLVEVFANLVQALYPFYQNPGVLLIWGIFFFLIADILFMQNRMEKLFRLLLAENRFY